MSIQSDMDYQQACVTTGACHHAVYATHSQGHTHSHPVWTAIPQYHYGYEQHIITPPAETTFAQAPILSPANILLAKTLAVDNQMDCMPVQSGQPMIYGNGIEVDYGQAGSLPVEFNVEELLEYQRRRSSATSEEKEPLTPAQRRRKAQNRAAQRSFRDRKRQRVQDLEAQMSVLEVRTNSLESDNQRLKHELLLTQNENELLRGLAQSQPSSNTFQPDRRRRVLKADGLERHTPF